MHCLKKRYAAAAVLAAALLATPNFLRAQDEKPKEPATTAPTTAGAVIKATDTDALKAAVGSEVTVRGDISGSYKGKSGVILLNFAGARRDFVAVVEKPNADAVNAAFNGDVAEAVKYKTVTITGLVQLYREKPQLVITKPEQIKIEGDSKPAAEPPAE